MHPRAFEQLEDVSRAFELHLINEAEAIAQKRGRDEVSDRHIKYAVIKLLKAPNEVRRCWQAREPQTTLDELNFSDSATDLISYMRDHLAQVLRADVKQHVQQEHGAEVSKQSGTTEVNEFIEHFIHDSQKLKDNSRDLLARALHAAVEQMKEAEEKRSQAAAAAQAEAAGDSKA